MASAEDIEVVRRIYDGFNGGEIPLELIDPEVEWRNPKQSPSAETFTGHEGVRRYVSTLMDVWDDLRNEPREIVDAGDHVVAVVDAHARGRASGIEVDAEWAHVWALRGGKAVSVQMYTDKDEAFRSVGLDPAG